jgi:hypothetical protein
MKRPFLILAGCALIACGEGAPPEEKKDEQPTATAPTLPASAKAYERIDLPNLDDNVKHDTLLIYTTHALGDGTFIMAAKNKDAADDGGLRLYQYRPKPDSSAEILAYSKEGFGSYTMLPVYFKTSDPADGWIIVTNMGERQSWGQEAFWFKDNTFKHLGWIDVAKREWKTEDEGTIPWRTTIAPQVLVHGENGSFEFSFTGDSVQVYDDLKGGSERMFPASAVQYRYDNGHWWLVINGEAREVKVPA